MNRICLTFLLSAIWVITITAQCGISGSNIIQDEENSTADTTLISIVISGAENNNLAHPDQGLCAVGIRFKHPFVKELVMELISPSGQKITLTGGNTTAYFTAFVTWDVKFVQSPPDGFAVPDPGFSEIWDNDQDWENYKTYKGDYYPHAGQLQQFNTGPVDGTWTLRCIDLADFGEGEILSFRLFFCDDRGLSCSQCRLDPGVFASGDLEFCSGSPDLLLNLEKNFQNWPPQTGNTYQYSNVVFFEGAVFRYQNPTNLTLAAPGLYTICPVQYAVPDQNKLPPIGSFFNNLSMNDAFKINNACAIVADSCIKVLINDDIPVTQIRRDICKGDSVLLNGAAFRESGIYQVRFTEGVCDSIVELDLRVTDIRVNISADQDSLNCFNNTISLIGSVSGTPVNNIGYRWFGKNNGVDTDSTEFVVDISIPGVYYLEVSGTNNALTCASVDSIVIFQDNSVPVTSLDAGILTCTQDEVLITLNSSRPVVNTIWESADGHAIVLTGNDANVNMPGKYIVTVISDNGCSVVDSISVIADRTVSSPEFTSDTLNCLQSAVTIMTTHPDTRAYRYFWAAVIAGQENMKNPLITEPGVYTLTLTNIENGCFAVFDTEVTKLIVLPEITSILVDTINCSQLSVTPIITSDMPITGHQWTGPVITSSLPSPALTQAGLYNVTITAANGCTRDSCFTVSIDTIKPLLNLTADKFTCNRDEVNIVLTADQEIIQYQWDGPVGFMSNLASPSVSHTGLYQVIVSTLNGCLATGQIILENDNDIPDVLITVPPITCLKDTVTAVSTYAPGSVFNFQWDGPGVLQELSQNPDIVAAGMYGITVTDAATGCTAVFSVNVRDDRTYPSVSITSEAIDCIKDSVQITLVPDMPLQSIVFSGPGGFSSLQQSPFVRQEGWYFVSFTNTLDCTATDSIFIERNDRFPQLTVPDYLIRCKQDSISLTAMSDIPGTAFIWSGPDGFNKTGNNVFAYTGGQYTVRGRAPNQCEKTLDFEIGYDTIAPELIVFTPGVLTCKVPQTTLSAQSATPGVSFRWEGPESGTGSEIDVQLPGLYRVIATGPNNCEKTEEISVSDDKNFPEFISSADSLNCRTQVSSITITTTQNDDRIIWSSGNPVSVADNTFNFNTDTPGIYRFTVINAEECTTESEINVIRDVAVPQIINVLSDSVTCANPVVTLAVYTSGNSESFIWQGPGIIEIIAENIIRVNEGGDYLFTITGSNFCVKDSFIRIIKNRLLPEFTTFSDTLTCEKGKITIGVLPISDVIGYNWSGNGLQSTSQTAIVFTPGIYTVTVTNSNGCSSFADITVPSDFEKPQFSIRDSFIIPCDSSLIELNFNTSDSLIRYKWTFPDGFISSERSPLTNRAGNYTLQVVGKNGCLSSIVPFKTKIATDLPVFEFKTDTITCIQPVASLKASSADPDVTFLWTAPSGTIVSQDIFNTDIPGIYILVAINALRCKDSVEFFVPIDTIKPNFEILQEGSIQCESRNVSLKSEILNADLPVTYKWVAIAGNIISDLVSSGITVNSAGIYELSATFARNGCTAVQTYILNNESQQLSEIYTTIIPPSCNGFLNGTIRIDSINGFPPYRITLNNMPESDNRNYQFLSPGMYTIKITDHLGCRLETVVQVPDAQNPEFSLPEEISILFGDSVLLSPDFVIPVPENWITTWSSPKEVICNQCQTINVMPFVNTLYTFETSIDGKCKQKASVLVKVRNDLNTSVPNIFRPFNGVRNDVFYIPQIRGIDKIISVKIFDRWAEPVFASFDHMPGDPSFGWDGTYKGKQAIQGVYVVVAEMILADGSYYRYVGDLTLVR
jgi:subtilisin-like proprotein convertase family protein